MQFLLWEFGGFNWDFDGVIQTCGSWETRVCEFENREKSKTLALLLKIQNIGIVTRGKSYKLFNGAPLFKSNVFDRDLNEGSEACFLEKRELQHQVISIVIPIFFVFLQCGDHITTSSMKYSIFN